MILIQKNVLTSVRLTCADSRPSTVSRGREKLLDNSFRNSELFTSRSLTSTSEEIKVIAFY